MKLKFSALFLALILVLSACSGGGAKSEYNITLLNHQSKEVTFPKEKPTLFFFITTYT